jgi:hypothetical protein
MLGDGYYSTVQQCSIADFEKWTRDDPRNNYNSDMRLLEYCKLMLLCYSEWASTPGKLKVFPDHGGNRTCDLWDITSARCGCTLRVTSQTYSPE